MNEKRLKEIEARKAEIKSALENPDEKVDLKSINEELDSLNAEKEAIEERAALARSLETGAEVPDKEEKAPTVEDTKEERNEVKNMNKEYRSAYLKNLRGLELTDAEKRAFTVSGAGAVIPVETADEIMKKIKDQAPLLNEITLLNVKGNVKFAVVMQSCTLLVWMQNAIVDVEDPQKY